MYRLFRLAYYLCTTQSAFTAEPKSVCATRSGRVLLKLSGNEHNFYITRFASPGATYLIVRRTKLFSNYNNTILTDSDQSDPKSTAVDLILGYRAPDQQRRCQLHIKLAQSRPQRRKCSKGCLSKRNSKLVFIYSDCE